jgi:phosphatidyl-myo-inositol dimannoside synthase
MNSLLITDTYLPRIGGRENYCHSLFTHLQDGQVVIATPDKTGNWQQFDQQCSLPIYRTDRILSKHWFELGRPGKIKWLNTLKKICWWHQIDVVHCGVLLPDGMTGWLLNQTLGKPYIIYAYGKEILENQLESKNRKLMELIINHASLVVSISQYTEDILKDFGVPEHKLRKILPGIDSNRWLTDVSLEKITQFKEKYNLGNKKVILTVARLIERKGHDQVIAAMPKILQHFPDTVYLIVGEGKDKARLENLRDQLGLENQIIFTGEVSDQDLLAYYKLGTVFAMISRQPPGSHEVEGFGIVYLEANISGLPVVAGNSGGIPDAVLDGETGYLVDPFSSEEVANAIIKLLENPQLRQEMARKGAERSIQELSWSKAGKILAEINKEVNAENRGYNFVQTVQHSLPFILTKNIFN